MKLRNKKTCEIREIKNILLDGMFTANSLAELNEEWEDYEEPKEYWYIDSDGEILCEPADDRCKFDMDCKRIGNYFSTKEEAEKAVEKLKAWKRLKDASFRLTGWYGGSETITYEFKDKPEGYIPVEECADLDLLFGGEECS